jgi:hypothetical protein
MTKEDVMELLWSFATDENFPASNRVASAKIVLDNLFKLDKENDKGETGGLSIEVVSGANED